MTFQIRLFRLLLCVCVIASLSCAVFADNSHDRTQFGHNIIVGPGEQVSDVTCFGCSVRVRGEVKTDVTTFGGSIIVEEQGQVGGDLTSFGGDVRLEKGASVHEVTAFGGALRRDPGALVQGDVTNFKGGWWMFLIFGLPLVVVGGLIALIIWIVRIAIRPRVPVAA